MKVTVLGAGAWGTALARLLSLNQWTVHLWGHSPGLVTSLRDTRVNTRYLPGIVLPGSLTITDRLDEALDSVDAIVVAVPSRAFRGIARELSTYAGPVVSVTKGIDDETGLTMCGLLELECPHAEAAALSGPTLAMEVARDIPSAIVAASHDLDTALRIQTYFHRPSFRVYTSRDLAGVELGGALKNVIAVAAGVCDGLGYGDNSKAALLTRGIVEMQRLGVACGADAGTFAGLSGLGDLTVTCFSRLSRNRAFGERLGRGESITAILPTLTQVAEGYPTSRSAYHLAQRLGVETPIMDQVYLMLHEGKPARDAVRDLTGRESKSEL